MQSRFTRNPLTAPLLFRLTLGVSARQAFIQDLKCGLGI